MSKKRKKGLTPNAKWLIALAVEIIILIVMGIGYGVYYLDSKYDKIKVFEDFDEDNLAVNEGANEDQKGYTTIAIFGIDARNVDSMGQGNRSDSIMIASINNDTKEVKIVSVYRDTLLEIADGSGITAKVNAAYSYGGPELAVKTLNANLDLEITEFVTVNFLALIKAIDHLGGVEVDVEENELVMLNGGVSELINITGIYSDGVFSTGRLLLNGTQATSYARIRSTDQGDITRTERQREVLAQMITRAKAAGMSAIDDIIDDVFPNVYTSITKDEMLTLAKGLLDYELSDTTGFPLAYSAVSHDVKGSILVPADLSSNVSALHEFLFGTENYQPTQNVLNTSLKIQNETGVATQAITIE